MKQTIKNIPLITLALTLFFAAGFMQKTTATPNPENPVELKLTDSLSGHPVFRLKIGNTEESEFYIQVQDADGTILYHEVLKGKNLSRRYLMNMEEADLNNIRFEVTNLKTHETQAYNITRNTHLVENLVVARL